MILHLDFETRSRVNLKHCGVYRYAVDPSTDALCAAYALGDGEPELWLPGDPVPDAILAAREVHAWNAIFERLIWQEIMVERYGWPSLRLEAWHDTAAAAAAMALPRKLEKCAAVLRVSDQKDTQGHRVMQKLSKPRRATKRNRDEWWTPETAPEDFTRLYEYCKQDVRTERAIAKRIRPLSAAEREIWLLDQRVNDRGVLIDLPLVEAAKKIADRATREANEELDRLTDGEVTAVTQAGKLTRWLGLDNLQKETLRDLIAAGDLEGTRLEAAQIRMDTAKTSTRKLEAMLRATGADGRARGLLRYHAASTGRWGGQLIQPQNFTRPTVKDVERFIPLVLSGEYDLIAMEEPPMGVVSSLLRSCLIAASGYRFVAGDYAQIEARVVAWIAEQDDLVDLFARGGKVYEDMAAFIETRRRGRTVTADEIEVGSEQRQIGKNVVLGCGFGMGWKKFQDHVSKQAGVVISDDDAVLAVNAYRERYARIPEFWREIEQAAIAAVQEPGRVTSCGRRGAIRYVCRSKFLWCVLPSGRVLAYALPRLEWRTVRYTKRLADGSELEDSFQKLTLTYAGEDSQTRQWKRHGAYGGLLTENVVQAMARDIMAAGMQRVEEAGYRPVLTVHDEILSETPEGHGSLEEYVELMKVRPAWAHDLPIEAEGWMGGRYRK